MSWRITRGTPRTAAHRNVHRPNPESPILRPSGSVTPTLFFSGIGKKEGLTQPALAEVPDDFQGPGHDHEFHK